MMSPVNLLISCILVAFEINSIVSLSNSLDVDFYSVNGFDEARCGLKTEWERVNYDSIGVYKPSNTSVTGLRATKESCVSSFPLYLVANSTLDVNVFVENEGCVMQIDLLDEYVSEILKKYTYDRSAKEFQLGWNKVVIPIDIEVSGYINLIGFCEENNAIIVDSLLYTPSDVKLNSKKAKSSPTSISYIQSPKINDDDLVIEDMFDDEDEGSGSGDGEPTEVPTESPIIDYEPEDSGAWTPLVISMTALGSAAGLSLVAGMAYYAGKAIATPNVPLHSIVLSNETQPRLIPRVKSVNIDPNYNRFR